MFAGKELGGRVTYADVTQEAGIDFVHQHGGTGERYFPETMGGGVLAFDFDGDGNLDLYFIQSGKLPVQPEQLHRNVLYRNEGGMRFVDVSERSGLADDGYGMGGAAADIDNDGDPDVYITNFGENRLYRNMGDGTFENVTSRAGVGDALWGASAAFADYDRDGYVDLYVVNYVDFTMENHKRCGPADSLYHSYCHPDEYNGVDDVLYRNRGDGTFEDVTREALPGPVDPNAQGNWISGDFEGKGLGVVWVDYDADGDPDIYVANDSTANYLFRNGGQGVFEHDFAAGVDYNEDGKSEASMGVDAGDINGDGWMDLFTVHLDMETNTLYLNGGDGMFSDETIGAGLAEVSTFRVGFGTNFLDFDNAGDQDIFVANGHIMDNIALFEPGREYAQSDFLFENDGSGKCEDVSHRSGQYFLRKGVGRGSAVGDFDNDGDMDIAVCNNNQPSVLLRNDGGSRNHFILIRLIGSKSNRDGVGALVRIRAGDREQTDELRCGTSYLSQSDLRLHFSLGDANRVENLEVRWPSGNVETFQGLPADHLVILEEGKGIISRKALRQGI